MEDKMEDEMDVDGFIDEFGLCDWDMLHDDDPLCQSGPYAERGLYPESGLYPENEPSRPRHPGEFLLEDCLEPNRITQRRLAREIGVPPRRVNEIVLKKRAITPDTALRLGRYFGLSARFWISMQCDYDLDRRGREISHRLEKEIRPFSG